MKPTGWRWAHQRKTVGCPNLQRAPQIHPNMCTLGCPNLRGEYIFMTTGPYFKGSWLEGFHCISFNVGQWMNWLKELQTGLSKVWCSLNSCLFITTVHKVDTPIMRQFLLWDLDKISRLIPEFYYQLNLYHFSYIWYKNCKHTVVGCGDNHLRSI